MRALLLGGAGVVGSMLADAWRHRHEVAVADLPKALERWSRSDAGLERRPIDVTDPEQVRHAVEGMDAVVHLAAVVPRDASGAAGEAGQDPRVIDASLRVNVASVVHALRSAREAGVGRFVHISSLSVFRDFGRLPIARGAEPDADAPYGLGKRLAETACRALAGEDLRVTSLRLAFPTTAELWPAWRSPGADASTPARVPELADGTRFGALHPDDLVRALDAALERPGPPFAALAVTGDTRGVSIDDDLAERLLRWRPERREPWLPGGERAVVPRRRESGA